MVHQQQLETKVATVAKRTRKSDLKPRVAVITGASRGVGAATALVLAKHGFRVVVNHRASAPQAEEVAATSPRRGEKL